ncbi:MAG: diguanylate cyclase [Thermoleophilia bacterium]
MLHLLAARESMSHTPLLLSYQGARKVAARLDINQPQRLEYLFQNVGLGKLSFDIGEDMLRITVSTTRNTHATGNFTVPGLGGGCDLERGLIDGALQLITGVPVATVETHCWMRGDENCIFEAIRSGAQGFIPVPIADSGPLNNLKLETTERPDGMRSLFMDLTAREMARAKRHGRELSVLYVDLDDLGKVNLKHGRPAGDQIISAVAAALSRSCRVEVFMWHHGEDEFAVVLSETGIQTAGMIARRLATEIRAAAAYVDVSATVSASIGFSTFPTHAETVTELFSSARSAVYRAKADGKGKAEAAPVSGVVSKHAATMHEVMTPVERRNNPSDVKEVARTARSEVAKPDADNPVISLVIASTSPLLLAGMQNFLASAENMHIAGEVSDAARVIEVAQDIRPDIIFVDMPMAGANNFAILRVLQADNLPCKLVVSAAEVDQEIIKMTADFSIDGVILQKQASKDIMTSLLSIYEGRTVLPDEIQTAVQELNSNRRLLNELSEREVEVLRLIAEGKSNSQISDDLFITVNTVRFHLANIYQKLSVSNRTEAANYYLRQDLGHDNQTKLL